MDSKFKKNFLKGSAAATIGTVASMFFHFLSIMLLTRNVEKNEFGIYVIILVIVNLSIIVSGFGLNVTLVKFITGKSEKDNYAAFRAVMVLRIWYLLFWCLVFYLLKDLILPLFELGPNQYVFYIIILFAASNFRDLFFNLLQGLRFYRKYASVQVISAAVRVATIYTFLQFDILTLSNLIFIEIITTVFSLIIQLFIIPVKRMLSVKPGIEIYKELFRFSFPVYLNNLLTFSHDRINIFIIGALLNPVSVALFDIASKIPEALQRIFQSFIIVFFPNQSKLFAEGKKGDAQNLMSKSLNILSFILISGVLLSVLFNKEIIILLFSSNYILSAVPFALLMLNLYIRIMSNIMGYTLVASGNASAPVKVNSVTTIINLAISLVLIPVIGFTGAVYSLLVMNTFSVIIYHVILVRSELKPHTYDYLRPLVLLFLLLIPFFFFQESVPVRITIFISYFILSWFFISDFKEMFTGLTRYLNKKGIISIT
jgi:O-antigen/teichoic acid export membrane protein